MSWLEYIAEPLRPLAIPIGKLVLDPNNARKHDERNIDSIKKSLAQFGQRLPLVVQRQGMVVRAGNGRVLAAKALGWSHVAVVIVDEKDVEATAFAIADNRTAELAEWDYGNLAEVLDTLKHSDAVIGFSQQEIEAIIANNPWEGVPDDEVDGGSPNPDPRLLVRLRLHDVAMRQEFVEALKVYLDHYWRGRVELAS